MWMTCFVYKNPQKTAKKLLEVINNFSKIARHKINIRK